MEGYKGGLKGYWKEKSNQHAGPRRQYDKAELGDGRRRRPWRIRISRRLRLLRRLASPKRILARIRDGYVRMMVAFAGSGVFGGGFGYPVDGVASFGRPQSKEYNQKVLVETFKSIIVQDNLLAAAAAADVAVVKLRSVGSETIDPPQGGRELILPVTLQNQLVAHL